jgi:DNA-binding response OmpR family regulator
MSDASKPYRPSVLVVDDESAIADTLAEILNRSGYNAMAAYDGPGALEASLTVPPELLITDVVLPGMNGIDLAIQMKRIFPDVKILLFSGQASTSDLLASAHGAGHRFTLLSKPVHPKDLLARVSESLKSRRPHHGTTNDGTGSNPRESVAQSGV